MKLIIIHPFGNSNVREALLGFVKVNLIYKFYTCIATFPDSLLDKISYIGPLKELKRRNFSPELKSYTHMVPFKEVGRQLAIKGNLKFLTKHESGFFSVDKVYQKLDAIVAKKIKKGLFDGKKAVYGYEDGSILSFIEAKKKQMTCFYDLPIGYWRFAHEILEKEKKKNPGWANTLLNFNDSQSKLDRKDQELSLADEIFVASTFTAETLKRYPDKLAPVHIIPYGFPPAIDKRLIKPKTDPLKLLFVGGLSQRKGLSYLFEAVAHFDADISLTIVGNKVCQNCRPLDDALSKYNWIPSLPHEEILELMRAHDVFVFPSLFEGFGLVITESMSQGTPVITTSRTAGPDLIEDGVNGWIVEAGSSSSLQECIGRLIEERDEVDIVGEAALVTARRRPWSMYGKELAEIIVKYDQTSSNMKETNKDFS